MKRASPKFLLAAILLFLSTPLYAMADDEEPELRKVTMTGYCLSGTMANGEETHDGVCAYRKEDVGKLAILYDEDMNFIGMYEIADVGGREAIRKGYVVDVWFPTRAECFAFTKKGFIQVVSADG